MIFRKRIVKKFKAINILVGGSATCVAEAQRLESLGFDFVIAQGGEAGGHRGSYLRDPYQSLTGTLALTRLVVRAVKLPVVAAGGIMDGAGIAAVARAGRAAGAARHRVHPLPGERRVAGSQGSAAEGDGRQHAASRKNSPASRRAASSNRFMTEMAAKNAPQLAFPAQNASPASCGRRRRRPARPISSPCGPARRRRLRAPCRRQN